FFKVAAVPFHQWAPDVYEGAPTPVTIYVSVASKTASFALLIRLFLVVFGASQVTWMYLVAGIAVASLTWGNLAALTQTNVKRFLFFPSFPKVVCFLFGFFEENKTERGGFVFSLPASFFMPAGASAVLTAPPKRVLIGGKLKKRRVLPQRTPAAAV